MKFYHLLISLFVMVASAAHAQEYRVTAYVDVEITSKLPGFEDLDRQRFEDDFVLVVGSSFWPHYLGSKASSRITPPIMLSKVVTIPTIAPSVIIALSEVDQFFDDHFSITELTLSSKHAEKMVMVYVPKFSKGPYADAFDRKKPRTLVAFRKNGSTTYNVTDSASGEANSIEADSYESDDFFPRPDQSEVATSKFKRLSTVHKSKHFVGYMLRIERLSK